MIRNASDSHSLGVEMHHPQGLSLAVSVCTSEVSAVIFFPGFEDSELKRWSWIGPVFRLPPDHSTMGLITITSIPVWSWSHSVRTLMRNMWSCPDTQSEETQSLTPSFSPLSSSLPPFSSSFFLTLFCFTRWVFCSHGWSFSNLTLLFYSAILSDTFDVRPQLKNMFCSFWSL